MKTLLLMRHAKAAAADRAMEDAARPLTQRGGADAERMAGMLAAAGLTPQAILSSPAVRTKQTVDMLLKNLAYAGDVSFYNELYASSVAKYLAILRGLSDTLSRVLLVGHNPEVGEFIYHMSGAHEHMKTASIARIELPLETWASLTDTSPGRLAALWHPNEV